jgi:hypothetical protein
MNVSEILFEADLASLASQARKNLAAKISGNQSTTAPAPAAPNKSWNPSASTEEVVADIRAGKHAMNGAFDKVIAKSSNWHDIVTGLGKIPIEFTPKDKVDRNAQAEYHSALIGWADKKYLGGSGNEDMQPRDLADAILAKK